MLAVGSVNKLLPIPGVAEHAHGFRGIPEALYLRDHVTRQIELAATTQDPREREARCTFVVVGAGYTGTEVAAQGPLFTDALVAPARALRGQRVALAAARPRRAGAARARHAALAHRGPGAARARGRGAHRASPSRRRADGVRLTTGEDVPTRTLVWCVGVRPDPLVEEIGLPTQKGRLVVDAHLDGPGPPRGVRLRRRGRGARPDPARAR